MIAPTFRSVDQFTGRMATQISGSDAESEPVGPGEEAGPDHHPK